MTTQPRQPRTLEQGRRLNLPHDDRNRWNKCNFTKGIPDHVCIDWLARQIIDADAVHFWITYLIDNLGPIEKEGIVKGGIQVYDEDELHKSYAMDLEEQKTKDDDE